MKYYYYLPTPHSIILIFSVTKSENTSVHTKGIKTKRYQSYLSSTVII